ncbi:cilia- and flagella-associated protein 61 [Genypterus blacodes]|uniref:cilia- and flagella-associated protein 61 n=1 Tax=Genypterus blacodes TaxID=154954 RepID=UPI003F75D827
MRTVTSSCGKEETVMVRRSESADAQGIDSLIAPSTVAVFGRVNVIHLLEKANLAVTLANEKDDVLAHASFFDHPIGDLVPQAHWEPFMEKHFTTEKYTPLSTLFLHLFVAEPSFASVSVKEIMRAVFNAVTELEYICLLSPNVCELDSALNGIFEPMDRVTDAEPQCLALVCHRYQLSPRLHVRPARIEDLDDITDMFKEQTNLHSVAEQPNLEELITTQSEENHTAVCEIDGVTVGFMSVTGCVDVKLLHDIYELTGFDGLCKRQETNQTEEETLQTETVTSEQTTEAGRSSEHPNAFCIQFFVINKYYDMRSVDFLPYVFQLFPEQDYCIITVPTLAPEFPLLKSFSRVPPRPTCTLPRELYIFHRAGLLSVEVRSSASADRPAICELVQDRSLHKSLLHDLDYFYDHCKDTDGIPLQAFVLEVQSQVVGIVIIRDEQDIEYIRARYNIENFIYFSHHRYEEHAQMCHFVIDQPVQCYTRHFLKETLRQSDKSCIYYRIYPPYNNQKNSCVHLLADVLDCMVPVRPRRQIIYPLEELGINAPSRQITKEQPPFALSLLSRKLTLEPKVTVNAMIVVVGASDTGLSFLEVLAFCPHLRFNNLTLISTHGFPGNYDHDNIGFLSSNYTYSSRELAHIPLHCCVNMVTGKMVAINREAKYVLVSDGRKVSYDHLILCTGQQYQVPCPSGVDLSQPITNSTLQPESQSGIYDGVVPSNLLTLNDPYDCVAARRWLSANFVELEDNAVIYGNSIDVYTTVETLLGLGIRGPRLHLALPPCEPAFSCFSDPAVEKAVVEALTKAEVQVHRSCLLARMNNGEDPDPLTSVSFTTDGEPLHLQCGVFINLSNKGIDYDAFRSINTSFLVFSGNLVIENFFQTTDPAIYGAGPLTKFSARYHTDEWTHSNFNSREVGQGLAARLLPLFDPTLELCVEPPSDMDCVIPIYKQAKIQGGKLPGGYQYLHVAKPSATDQSASSVQHVSFTGKEIVTGQVETGNYFWLRLDCYETVETFTCLSLKPIPVSNYLSLYGKHQQLLGQLSCQHDQGLIHNLYSFFRQRWLMAVYHDRFPDFQQELQQIFTATQLQDGESIQQVILQLVEGKLNVNDPAAFLQEMFEQNGGQGVLTSSTVNYLTYNKNLLPMFARSGQL